MENSYVTLIEQERAKIALLKAKIIECEHRIQMLQSMMNADDLDNILAKTVAHEARPQATAQRREQSHEQSPEFETPKKKLSPSAIALLNFIGVEGKSLDELESFSKQEALGVDRGALRSFASTYRNKFGFLDSSGLGFFHLTERGREYMMSHGAASKSETPPVGAEGVSFPTNQAAVEGGTESDDLL